MSDTQTVLGFAQLVMLAGVIVVLVEQRRQLQELNDDMSKMRRMAVNDAMSDLEVDIETER